MIVKGRFEMHLVIQDMNKLRGLERRKQWKEGSW